MFFYHELDYVVPIAFQDGIGLISDFRNEIVNDIFNYSQKYKIQILHLCVFPLKDKSVIIMFIKDGCSRYRDFYKDFKKLNLEDKLRCITYIMFAYSEDIFFSKKLEETIKKNNMLSLLASQTSVVGARPFVDKTSIAISGFSLDKRQSIPNLLSAKFKIN